MKHRSRLATLAYLSVLHDVRVSLFAALDQAESRANEDRMGLAAISGQARRRPWDKNRNLPHCRAE
jgi:hypothetical protein